MNIEEDVMEVWRVWIQMTRKHELYNHPWSFLGLDSGYR